MGSAEPLRLLGEDTPGASTPIHVRPQQVPHCTRDRRWVEDFLGPIQTPPPSQSLMYGRNTATISDMQRMNSSDLPCYESISMTSFLAIEFIIVAGFDRSSTRTQSPECWNNRPILDASYGHARCTVVNFVMDWSRPSRSRSGLLWNSAATSTRFRWEKAQSIARPQNPDVKVYSISQAQKYKFNRDCHDWHDQCSKTSLVPSTGCLA